MRIFAFDFDGTLVDSYSCLNRVYELIAEKLGLPKDEFVKRAIELEDFHDSIENYDRQSWWKELFSEFEVTLDEKGLNEILNFYWKKRAEMSEVAENCEVVLKSLRKSGKILAILAGNDGKKSVKRWRIEMSGLAVYFDEILIVGEDVESRVEGVQRLSEKYDADFREIVIVDDKPAAINEVKRTIRDVVAVKVEFRGILKRAWKGDSLADFSVKRIGEIPSVLRVGVDG